MYAFIIVLIYFFGNLCFLRVKGFFPECNHNGYRGNFPGNLGNLGT